MTSTTKMTMPEVPKAQKGYVAPEWSEEELSEREARSEPYDTPEDWDLNYKYDATTERDAGMASLAAKAEYVDFLSNTPHNIENNGVELDAAAFRDAIETLVIAVWGEVRQWKKQPKAEVIAKAAGLALALARGERGVKHPRDLAKEVSVKYETFLKVLSIAKAEEARLCLAADLSPSDCTIDIDRELDGMWKNSGT